MPRSSFLADVSAGSETEGCGNKLNLAFVKVSHVNVDNEGSVKQKRFS